MRRKLFPTPSPTNNSIACPENLCLDPDCPFGDCYPYPDPPPPPPPPPKFVQPIKISPLLIIVISVVSSLVILIIYFVIVLRRRTRPVRRNASEENSQIEEELGVGDDAHRSVDHHVWLINTVGLQQSVINTISIVKYRRGEGVIEGTDCSVCLSEFREGETLRLLPKCSHAFHVGCIDTWLRSHTNCPMCRACIVVSGIAGPSLASSDRSFGNSRRNEVGRVIDPEISEVELTNDDGVSEEFAEIAVGRWNGIDSLVVDRDELKRVRRCVSMGYMNSRELVSGSSWRFVQPLQGSQAPMTRSRSSGSRLHEIHDGDSLLKYPA